ncbi:MULTISPECIES: acyl-CoA carboxylase subunit epsilon [unclassified Streptomyces]|uniref:acyl-CoA carboxylase subunit epsilon n=1 Tax=unclassified Streptomyces TaxID=2593676 RepID=UPI0033F03894
MIKVERGNPTPEELAAVVALVQARAAAAPGAADGPRSADEWADPARNVPSRALRPAPAAWRATYWPH